MIFDGKRTYAVEQITRYVYTNCGEPSRKYTTVENISKAFNGVVRYEPLVRSKHL